jgi:hypothetical protein
MTPAEPVSNWRQATRSILEVTDAELALLIQIITEFEQHHARTISAAELRARLQRPAW